MSPTPETHPAGASGTSPAARGAGIDPRGPRFSASIMSALLIVTVFTGLVGAVAAVRILLAVAVVIFAWGAIAGVRRHPFGVLFRRLVRPHLDAPAELEDPAAPRFAQLVGLIVTGVGLLLALVGLPAAAPIAAALAFVAAFLNAAFGYCIGCQMYVLLVRAGAAGRRTA